MSRLIDADKLWKHKFKSASERMDLDVVYIFGWNDAIDSIVENAPTVDTEPIRHGHWIKRTKVHPDLPNDSTYNYTCSNCGYWDTHGADVEVPYCWHCGAKMGEEAAQ